MKNHSGKASSFKPGAVGGDPRRGTPGPPGALGTPSGGVPPTAPGLKEDAFPGFVFLMFVRVVVQALRKLRPHDDVVVVV